MDDSPQSAGGKKRAANLTPERRKEIAQRAARKRWDHQIPHVVAAGERQVSNYSFPVYNLSNGERVLSERGFLAVIGARGRGAPGGHRIRRILADKVLKSFFSNKLLVAIEQPVEFVTEQGVEGRGYTANTLKEFCFGFVRARESNALRTEAQMRYASSCQTLILAFADMGIHYWIDEATGYQDHRLRDELHKILERYIADNVQKWSKTFPDEFYQEMCRLKGWKYTQEFLAKKPGVVGHYTNDLIYARLAPGVLDVLREKNPVIDEGGNRLRKHHQWLTRDHGHPKLKEHLTNVVFMMRGAQRWDTFYRQIQRAAPKMNEMPEFDFGDL